MKSVFKIFILVIIQCNKAHEISSFNVNTNSPNICDNGIIDSAFSDEKHQIRVIGKDWIWTYNEKEKRTEKPEKQNTKKSYLLQTEVYFCGTPDCQTISNNDNCAHILRANNLIIILYKERNAHFKGSYWVKKVVNGVITNVENKALLPFGLQRNGNIYSNGDSFWPKELSLNEKHIIKNQTAIAYNPKNFKLIIIVNRDLRDGSILLWNKLDPNKNWTNEWNSKTIDNSWTYIGMFFMGSNVYVFGVKDTNSRVFIYSDDNELKDTQLNIQRFIGCFERKAVMFRKNNSQYLNITTGKTTTKHKKEAENSSMIIIIVVAVLIIVLALILVFVFYICYESNSVRDEPKFGDLDSKLSLQLRVAEMSTESINPSFKSKPKQESVGEFFSAKKKKQRKHSLY